MNTLKFAVVLLLASSTFGVSQTTVKNAGAVVGSANGSIFYQSGMTISNPCYMVSGGQTICGSVTSWPGISNGEQRKDDYHAVAKSIGLSPSASTDEADVLEAIEHSQLHVYDFDKVDGYLYRRALREKSPSRWVWKPMRKSDVKANAAGVKTGEDGVQIDRVGYVSATQYSRVLPMRVMENVKSVLDCLPDAVFLVSDYEVIRPDPFLAVTTPRLLEAGKIWIIDCWDEPGFTESAPAVISQLVKPSPRE
jgi:hypothetical protein